jgi:hypothetical protein
MIQRKGPSVELNLVERQFQFIPPFKDGAQMKRKLLVVIAGLILISGAAYAHHGRSNYDVTQTATVKGIVTEYEWSNPHVLIHFDVTGDDGKVEKWIGETNSPNTLSRQGWTRDTVKVGDQITLVGRRIKSGGTYINFTKIKWADGRELTPSIVN